MSKPTMIAAAAIFCGVGALGAQAVCAGADWGRLVTASDGIKMTELADPWYLDGGSSCGRVASVAPSGKELVVVLRSGDVKKNLNKYTMLLWKTNGLASEQPRVILRAESSSIRPAIDPSSISWGQDSGSLTFLGEQPGENHEVFRLDLRTGGLRALTNHSTSIVAYSRSQSGAIAYEALPAFESLWDVDTSRQGLVVTNSYLVDLIAGRRGSDDLGYEIRGRIAERQLFIQDSRDTREIRPLSGSVFRGDPFGRSEQDVAISPNGRYVVVVESVPISRIPATWRQYRDWTVEHIFSILGRVRTTDSFFSRYVLVDVRSGSSRVLINTPVVIPRPVIWAPNSRSVIVSGVLLPLDVKNVDSREALAPRATLEVNVEDNRIVRVGANCDRARSWDSFGLSCEREPDDGAKALQRLTKHAYFSRPSHASGSCIAQPLMRFHKVEGKWRETGGMVRPPLQVYLKEGMNLPPKIYWKRDADSGENELLDLNPQFGDLRFGEVQEVTWEWSKGRRATGGLYYPPHYEPGRRYPLVIQTHGWDPNRFEFFGPYPTANAAQPLAARNIFVLQVNDLIGYPEQYGKDGQLREVQTAVKLYETAIDYLARKGLIERSRVGIVGFSHTCFYVKWALAHNPDMFAAASVAEGEDGGYLQYITGLNVYVDAPSLYGGGPSGRYLPAWVRLSPGFNLANVRAPLWINVLNPRFVLGDWEWFEGLRDLGKPVEMVMLDGDAHEEHILQKPMDRLVSEGGNVDWFDFWLNGHEDPDAAKTAQYTRWRHLRSLYGRRHLTAARHLNAGRPN